MCNDFLIFEFQDFNTLNRKCLQGEGPQLLSIFLSSSSTLLQKKKKGLEGSKQETKNNRFSLNPKLYENDIYRNIIATIDRAPRMFVRAYTEKEEKSEGGAEIYRRRARLNTGSKRRNELPTNRLPAIPLFYIPCWTETRRPLSSSSSLPRLGKRPRVLSPKAIGLLFFSPPPSPSSCSVHSLFPLLPPRRLH